MLHDGVFMNLCLQVEDLNASGFAMSEIMNQVGLSSWLAIRERRHSLVCMPCTMCHELESARSLYFRSPSRSALAFRSAS